MNAVLHPLEDRTLLSADLTGSLTSVPIVVNGGTRQAIAYTIANQGNDTFRGAATVDFYAAPVGTSFNPATATFLGSATRGGALPAGTSRTFTANLPFGPQFTTGMYQIYALINPNNTNAESNLANNLLQSNPISVTEPNFDLGVAFGGNVNVPMNTTAGVARNGSVQLVVSNPSTSTTTIPPRQFVNVQLAAEPLGSNINTGGTLLNSNTTRINVGRLAPGRSRTITVPVQLPASLPVGTLNLVARVNTNGAIAESSMLNNQIAFPSPLVISAGPTAISTPVKVVSGSPGTVPVTTPGTIVVGNVGSVGQTVVPIGTVSGFGTVGTSGLAAGVTPTTSAGVTPINSAGALPLGSAGATPINALGVTPTTSIGQFTPTSFGNSLLPNSLSPFVV